VYVIFPDAFNPSWLDVYYDTIGQISDTEIYKVLSENDPVYYNKFGSQLDDLIILPVSIE
jgi:hypothetical protein